MMNYIDQYSAITGYGTNPVGSRNWGVAQEKLRGLKVTTTQRIADWQRQYQLDPMSPQVGNPYKYTRPAERVKLPDMPADEAMKSKTGKPPPSARFREPGTITPDTADIFGPQKSTRPGRGGRGVP
jgi:hypothetical protein